MPTKSTGGSEPGWYAKVTPDQVKAIREMEAAGQKIARIARITGLSRPTVYRVLWNQEHLPPSSR